MWKEFAYQYIIRISPCVQVEKKVATSSGAKIKIEADGSYVEEVAGGGARKLEKASITLADCLACSGCITSAETVLIEQQSADQVNINTCHFYVISLSIFACAHVLILSLFNFDCRCTRYSRRSRI